MPLEFQINLGGNFAEAMKKDAAAAGEASKGIEKAKGHLEAFESELGRVNAGAASLNFSALKDGGKFFTFDIAEGAKLAYEAIKKVGEAVVELGVDMIKAAAGAEDLNLAVKLNVGDEGLEKVSKIAESFGNTRFDDRDLKTTMLQLLEESGTEHGEQWDDLLTAATDVATRRNSGAAGAKAAFDALRSIEIMPQKIRGSLKELGIKQVDFYADLGDLLGISAKTAEAQTKAGKVKSETLLSVALNQIAQRQGGALGLATNAGSETLGTAIERLKNLKENFFEQLAGGSGMQAVKDAINSFVEAFNGPAGKRLTEVINDVFEKLGHAFTVENVTRWTEKAIAGAEGVAKVIGKLIDVMTKAWEIAEKIAKPMGWAVEFGDKLLSKSSSENGAAQWAAERAGGRTAKAGRELGEKYALLDQLGLGNFIPKMAEGGVVSQPTLALIGEAGPEAVVPLGRGGGLGSPSFTFGDVIIQGVEAKDAREIAREVRIELMRFMDEANATLGGS